MVLGLPSAVQIIRIEPAEVRVRLDEIIEIRNRVLPRFKAPEDTMLYVTGSVEVLPKTVDLRGTRDDVGAIEGIVTDSIAVAGPPGTKSILVDLVVPGNVTAKPGKVTVTYEVGMRVDTSHARRPR